MKLEVKIQLLRFCSTIFNCIFLALGLSVAGCAVWILFDKGSFINVISSVELKTVGAGLLLIGGVVMVVGVLGCLGAQLENRLLLLMYLGLLIVLVLGQLFITLLLLMNRQKIEGSLDTVVDQIIKNYTDSGVQDRLMDNVQRYGACCGQTGPDDWLKNSFIQSLNLTGPDVLPCSCFNSSRHSFNSVWCSELQNLTEPLIGRANGLYDKGCKQKLTDWLQENALTIIGMDLGLILIQVVQFVLVVYLYRAFGQKAALKRSRPLVDPSHAHTDHAHLDHAHLDHAPDDAYGEQNYAYVDPVYDCLDPAHPALYHDNPNHGEPAHLAYRHDNQM